MEEEEGGGWRRRIGEDRMRRMRREGVRKNRSIFFFP
jgi:hypothetical protein